MRISRGIVLCVLLLTLGCQPMSFDDTPGPVDPNIKGSLTVVIVKDEGRSEPLPSGVVTAISSEVVQEWLESHCEADSKKMYPKTQDLSGQSANVQKVHSEAVKFMNNKKTDMPVWGMLRGKKTYVGMVQDSPEKMLEMLQKYGGK